MDSSVHCKASKQGFDPNNIQIMFLSALFYRWLGIKLTESIGERLWHSGKALV